MPLLYQSIILRADLISNPSQLYVFGDNLARVGFGGQAKEMRGRPNAVGLPTKRSPQEYLINADLPEIEAITRPAAQQLSYHLALGGVVVWPRQGIGTGLAALRFHASDVASFYEVFLNNLARIELTPELLRSTLEELNPLDKRLKRHSWTIPQPPTQEP